MRIFKFGGASIKNASAIRNMCEIIRSYRKDNLIVIVSAMGKTTNALEKIHACNLQKNDTSSLVEGLITYHADIANELFENHETINKEINKWKLYLEEVLSGTPDSPSQLYDSVVSVGELLSSTIISFYLNTCHINTVWTDARQLIRTDNSFKEANVDWDKTKNLIGEYVKSQNSQNVILTQGFIAATEQGQTTTLGREGSDFTGAIFASCLAASSFTVWKDVAGIFNADPKRIKDAVLFDELPYNEASEMTYYGAKVIHPDTIKPLANQKIPLYVKCFDKPKAAGTKIHNCEILHTTPVVVFKESQCLVSFKSKDLAFVNEKGISDIFDALHDLSIVMNIMQNSAVSFSICIDYHEHKINSLIDILKDQFDVLYNTGLELVTIKNYSAEAIDKYRPHGEILLEQKSRNNYRVLMASSNSPQDL